MACKSGSLGDIGAVGDKCSTWNIPGEYRYRNVNVSMMQISEYVSKDRLRLLVVGALLAIAGMNVFDGIRRLLTHGGGDLHLRWQEEQYVLRHKNPFDVYQAA